MDVRRRVSLDCQALRRARGGSQESGLHRTYVSGVERGVRNPTLSVLDKIAQALQVRIGDLTDTAPADIALVDTAPATRIDS